VALTSSQSRVIAQTIAANAGSRGVLQALGMRYVRTYFPPWDNPLPGAELGEVECEMTRETWKAQSRE
jgi:RimJ/RimL family protein N-acetyltransferase